VTASTSDLFLALYNRIDTSALDLGGDATLMARWRAAVQI